MSSHPKHFVIEHRPAKENHPLAFVSDFCLHHPEIVALEFGIYRYEPQTIEDKRKIVRINPADVSKRYKRLERTLNADEEIALQSRVYVRSGLFSRLRPRIYHIPMIDFAGDVSKDDLKRIGKIAKDFHCEEMAVFYSGRSFHFYGFTLLSREEWIQFMGQVLLLNLPKRAHLVDCRWVGHRLLAGYSALRWSKNTKHYKQPPEIHYQRQSKAKHWEEVGHTLKEGRPKQEASRELVEV